MERRRTGRVTLTVPVRVRGVDEEGKALECEARTVSINRHGARIEVSRPLPAGQLVRLANPANSQEASFRVVGLIAATAGAGGVYAVLGPVSASDPKGREFGVESVDTQAHFWGLYFPPLPPNDLADSKVALECRKCHQPRALRLSIVEVDVLESSGSLRWACSVCRVITPWGYPEKDRKMPGDDENGPG